MFHSKGFQSENRDYSEITKQTIQCYENVIQDHWWDAKSNI